METTRIKLNRPVTNGPNEKSEPIENSVKPPKVGRIPKFRPLAVQPAPVLAPVAPEGALEVTSEVAPVAAQPAPVAPEGALEVTSEVAPVPFKKSSSFRKGKKGPNVLTVKKQVVELATKFFPKKYARTTMGSNIQVGGFLFRVAGGSGTPNLLATYRKFAKNGGEDLSWVVAMDTETGRPVVLIDAESLFKIFAELGPSRLVKILSGENSV